MFREYGEVVEFRIVYINEAHAADGRRPVDYAVELGIHEHADLKDRCTAAEKLLDDKALTIPCLIDGMDNAVNEAYQAWPDRLFLVRSDGRLAVVAGRGPAGFKPAVKEAKAWLKAFKESGMEPDLKESVPSIDGRRGGE